MYQKNVHNGSELVKLYTLVLKEHNLCIRKYKYMYNMVTI